MNLKLSSAGTIQAGLHDLKRDYEGHLQSKCSQ